MPLKFFDSRTHGEILSRAVNDLDNISSTLQQNLTQLISSVLSGHRAADAVVSDVGSGVELLLKGM